MAKYLYNGEELPALPEWDSTTYPYAYIEYNTNGGTCYFTIRSEKAYIKSGATGSVYLYDPSSGLRFPYTPGEDEWRASFAVNAGTGTTYSIDGVPTKMQLLWANFDVLNEDGTLYLAASDPIPVSTFTPDPMSLTMGWIVGRRIAGQRGKYVEPDVPDVPDVPEKEPIAYLYNGVQLPDINEVWTDELKAEYPYAAIELYNTSELGFVGTAACITFANKAWAILDEPDSAKVQGPYKVQASVYVSTEELAELFSQESGINVEAGVWSVRTSDSSDRTDVAAVVYFPIWTSHDILNTDGTLYLAASEPVPVYES